MLAWAFGEKGGGRETRSWSACSAVNDVWNVVYTVIYSVRSVRWLGIVL